MAKVFLNRPLLLNGEKVWKAQNNPNKRLLIINNIGDKYRPVDEIKATLKYTDKSKDSILYINPEESVDDKILGIFIGNGCNHESINDKEVWKAFSIRPYDNRTATIGIYDVGAVIINYRFISPPTYFLLTEEGWIEFEDNQVNYKNKKILSFDN